jgi:hypothetical protein
LTEKTPSLGWAIPKTLFFCTIPVFIYYIFEKELQLNAGFFGKTLFCKGFSSFSRAEIKKIKSPISQSATPLPGSLTASYIPLDMYRTEKGDISGAK